MEAWFSSVSLRPHAQSHLLSPLDKCKICNEPAAKTVHYGAMTCFSCRAFFRRSIQNKTASTYVCRRDKTCEINLKTRKNCQFCRYSRCLAVGMKPTWVLSEEERQRRFGKNREKHEQDGSTGLANSLNELMSCGLPPVKGEYRSDSEEERSRKKRSYNKRSKEAKGKAEKGKPRWTAYLLWSTRKRRDVVVDHPDWTFAQIAKWISDEWKKIEADEKDELQKEAEEMNELGIRKLPRDNDGRSPDPDRNTTDDDSDFEEGYRKKSKPIMLKIKKEAGEGGHCVPMHYIR